MFSGPPGCLPVLFKLKSESEVAQSCLTLCDPMDCSLPGSSVHGSFQARILEWVAISFSRRSSWPRDWNWVSGIVGRRFNHLSLQRSLSQRRMQQNNPFTESSSLGSIPLSILTNQYHVSEWRVKSLSRVRFLATPWTVAYQAPPSMGFSRQEYWSGLPLPSPGDLPDSGIKPRSPALRADALTSEPPGKPRKW